MDIQRLQKFKVTELNSLAKEYKIACLIVTHNMELANTIDNQFRIEDGLIKN